MTEETIKYSIVIALLTPILIIGWGAVIDGFRETCRRSLGAAMIIIGFAAFILALSVIDAAVFVYLVGR